MKKIKNINRENKKWLEETDLQLERSKNQPAFFRSWNWPDLIRTSRSTWLKDKSPRASPDVTPANNTSTKLMARNTQKSSSQHGMSSFLMLILDQYATQYKNRLYGKKNSPWHTKRKLLQVTYIISFGKQNGKYENNHSSAEQLIPIWK